MKQKIIRFKKQNNEKDTTYTADILGELEKLPEGKYEIVIHKPARTDRQNNAMHLFYDIIAKILNENHIYFHKDFFKEGFKTEWNQVMIKELIWRPIQKALYKKKSTKELKTDELNKIAGLIQDNLVIEYGLSVDFPSIDSLLLKTDENN